jgi:hypothetical protein
MSDQALTLLHSIEDLIARTPAARSPSGYFGAGTNNAAYQELAAAGLIIKMLGTARGFGWRLTAAGEAHLSTMTRAPAA